MAATRSADGAATGHAGPRRPRPLSVVIPLTPRRDSARGSQSGPIRREGPIVGCFWSEPAPRRGRNGEFEGAAGVTIRAAGLTIGCYYLNRIERSSRGRPFERARVVADFKMDNRGNAGRCDPGLGEVFLLFRPVSG